MIVKFLKKLKDWVDPNYWANEIGEKSGAYDKARNSNLRPVSYTHLTLPTKA